MSNYNSSLGILELEYVQDTSPDPVEDYISSFSELPEGWNFGEGRAPSSEVILRGIEVYKLGRSFGCYGERLSRGGRGDRNLFLI